MRSTRLALAANVTLVSAVLITTSAEDFRQPGTQPGGLSTSILPSASCASCHAGYDPDQEPHTRWAGSMMANSTRDPMFHAALAIANQDLEGSGELCIRCHAPGGWLAGNSSPTDGSALAGADYDGVTCNFCHRMVDPFADPANPSEDSGILAALADAPQHAQNGQYVVDPEDRRRGPYDLGPGFNWHDWLESPFHRESLLCATCHEVSNPVLSRVGGPVPSAGDTYVQNTSDAEHPTHDPLDQFPIERTYTEWSLSDFADGPVEMGGRFGGNLTAVSSCQDCHMPDTDGTACKPQLGGAQRTDLPQHDFNGANSWVPLAIHSLDQSLLLYGASEASGQPLSVFQDAVQRNVEMLQRACDLELSVEGRELVCRVVNQTGHKLPTGYPEGRRMWLNVLFHGADGSLLHEHGYYDAGTALLDTADTKVWEVELGLDAAMAAATGIPAGPSFHFVLNNKVYKDNRIPPRGFDNAAFEAHQILPVGAVYPDGQHWDDTRFPIPAGAIRATVTVFHQTTTREYVEFLMDENVTNDAGDIAWDEWLAAGKSAPVPMATDTLVIHPMRVRPRRR